MENNDHSKPSIEETTRTIAKYHIEKRLYGTVDECLQRAEPIENIKSEYAKMKSKVERNEWGTIIRLAIILLICIVLTIIGVDFRVESNGNAPKILGVVLGIYGIYEVYKAIQTKKEVRKFYKYANALVGNNNYEPFYSGDTYYIKRYDSDRHYKWKKQLLQVAKRELGDCLLYKIDYPLLPNEELPEGMDLASYWLFEKDGNYYQVAVGEDLEDEISYMVLPVLGNPVKTQTREIEQEL